MPPTKQAPPRSCGACGRTLERKRYNGRLEDFGVFQRRKFCDEACFSARPQTLKSDPSWMTAHYHARKLVPKGPCSRCGKPNATDVHHIDGDHRNNDLANLTRLCRSCHVSVERYGALL